MPGTVAFVETPQRRHRPHLTGPRYLRRTGHRGHAHRGGQPRSEHHAIHRTAHRHRSDRLSGLAGAADRGRDATESEQRLLALERDTVGVHLSQLDGQLGAGRYRVPGLADPQIHLSVPVAVRQDRFADGGAVRGLTPADPGRDRSDHAVADLFQVDDVGTVENREVYHESGGAVQFAQQRGGRSHEAVLVDGQRAQLHQPHAQLVVAAAAVQPAQLDQALEHAVRR
jgi:hypothetical protein